VARVLDGFQNGRFGNLVEDDAVGVLLVQSQYLAQMPADGFSFAVLIGCQPYGLCSLCVLFQILTLILSFYASKVAGWSQILQK
jgi:hypothetical protein